MDRAEFTCACEREIEALHRFFVDWFRGALPDTDEAWSRFADAVAPGFTLVAPSGEAFDRDALLEGLRGRHGAEGPASDFAIWIRNFRDRHVTAGLATVTYEEWQRRAGEERGRLSTAVFLADAQAPNGVRWVHVHETWLPRETGLPEGA